MNRTVKVVVVAIAVFAVTLSGALLLELDAPELGRTALAAAGKTLGIGLSAAESRWSFRRGLVLGDVEASSVVSGSRLTLRVEELVFEHRLASLLAGEIVVERVRLTRPRAKLVSLQPEANTAPPSASAAKRASPGKKEGEQPSEPRTEFTLEVDEIAIEEGALLWQREPGRADRSLDGLHLVLTGLAYDSRALTPIHGLDAMGEIRAKSVRWEPIAARELQGRLTLAKGTIEMRSLALETENSYFDVDLALNLNQFPPGYAARVSGRWDLQAVMGAEDAVRLADLEMEVKGFGGEFEHLEGEGTATMEGGKLPSWPLWVAMDAELDGPSLVGGSYETVTAAFRLETGQVHLDDVEVRTHYGNVLVRGTASFDGSLDLEVVVRKLSGDELPWLVGGTIEEPVVVRADR